MKTVRPACFVLALAGCGASVSSGSIELTGASYVPAGAAAGAIGQTECARAQACGAVVSRGIYRDADYCDTDLREKIDDDLFGGACKWVDGARLGVCLDALRVESCATLGVTERTPPPCRRAWLCR